MERFVQDEQYNSIRCEIHEDEEVIAVCLKEECELQNQRFLCLNCLLNDHSMHPQSCVKLSELKRQTKYNGINHSNCTIYSNSNINGSSLNQLNILNWPQDKAIHRIIRQLNEEKKKEESDFIDTLFLKFEQELVKHIQIAKQQVKEIIKNEKNMRSTFISQLEHKLNSIIDLEPLKNIIFDMQIVNQTCLTESLSQSFYQESLCNSQIIQPIQGGNLKYAETQQLQNELLQSPTQPLVETKDTETNLQQLGYNQSKYLKLNTQNTQNIISVGQPDKNVQSEHVIVNYNIINDSLIQTSEKEEEKNEIVKSLIESIIFSKQDENGSNRKVEIKKNLKTRSIKLTQHLRNTEMKKRMSETRDFFGKNKWRFGSTMLLKSFSEEKSLILSQIEDLPWILLKVFTMEKQKVQASNTEITEENTLVCFSGGNTSCVAYSDQSLSMDNIYTIKLQLQNANTQHLLVGIVPDTYKDTLNFNSQCWIYLCLICKSHEHCKNMKKANTILSNPGQNKISSLITLRICLAQNSIDIYDINDMHLSTSQTDINLKTSNYRFFIASYSSQQQNVQIKLLQAIKIYS